MLLGYIFFFFFSWYSVTCTSRKASVRDVHIILHLPLTLSSFCFLTVGPQNTVITASPGNSPVEGDSLNLTCVTQSNPPAQIVWSKYLAEESIQHLIKNNVLFIPRVHFNDSGRYICEVINLVTNKTEEATVDIIIQGTSLFEFHLYNPVPNWLTSVRLEDAETLKIRKIQGFPFYIFRTQLQFKAGSRVL